MDSDDSAGSGYLALNGIELQAGIFHTIDAEDLANLRYFAGTAVGSEIVRVRANDGIFNSNTATSLAFTVRENTTRPVFNGQNFTSVSHEFIKVSTIFGGFDPDGWPTIRYKFRDKNAKSNSGYFVLDGVRQASNSWFYVRADQFDQLEYFTGTSQTQENILGRMFDGELWSQVARSKFVTTRNVYRPVVQANYIAKGAGEEFAISELFDVSDRDGNLTKWYEFRDSSNQSDSGFITVNGVVQPSSTWIRIQAEDLANTTFTTGTVNRLDNIAIKVSDGRHISVAKRAYVAVSTRPVVEPKPPLIFDGDEIVDLVSIIDQSDDGPRNVRYRIYDDSVNPFSTRFELDGNVLNPKQVYTFDAATMDRVDIRTGDFNTRRYDRIFVQTFNGVKWSVWRALTIATEPRILDALANVEDTVINNRNSWRQWLPGAANEPLPITYSFREIRTAGLDLFTSRFTNAERIQARNVLDRVESILNVDFQEISDNFIDPITGNQGGTIRIGHGILDIGFSPDDTATVPWGGDIFLSDIHLLDQMQVGTTAHATFLRMLGNALGLRAANSTTQVFDPTLFKWPLPTDSDDMRHTVMSNLYNPSNQILDMNGDPTGAIVPVEPTRFGIYDMNALLELYGGAEAPFRDFDGDDLYGNTGNTADLFDWSEKVIGTFEHLDVHTSGPENTVRLTAVAPGANFPDITFTFVRDTDPNVAESIDVTGGDIAVTLGTDADGNIISTAASVIALINADAGAAALVTADVLPGETGLGLIGGAYATTTLSLLHDKAVQTSIVGDSGGDDTFDVSLMNVSSVIDLTPGAYSSVGEITADFINFYPAMDNIVIGHSSIIENAIGGPSDEIIRGNFTDNTLIGNDGDDVLIGGGGTDYLFGGRGNDTYRWYLTDQDEMIDENVSGGNDILELNSHWGMDSITDDMTFMRDGNNLVIDLNFNGSLSQGIITLKDQNLGLSQVETLRLNFINGTSTDVDMQSLFTGATSTPQNFQLTMDVTQNGFIAVPV